MSEITFFHGAGCFFEDGIPWKLPTLELLSPVYGYNLEYEETEAGRNCWELWLLSNFSKVAFDSYIKSKDDNHPHFIFLFITVQSRFFSFSF